MGDGQLERIEETFHKARILPATDRAAYLDEICDGDLELRREVESLLAHVDRGTTGMNLRAGDDGGTAGLTQIVDRGRPAEGPGAHIGPYKILQQIGEGGFGVVYMAGADGSGASQGCDQGDQVGDGHEAGDCAL